jgi:hypothetical protein
MQPSGSTRARELRLPRVARAAQVPLRVRQAEQRKPSPPRMATGEYLGLPLGGGLPGPASLTFLGDLRPGEEQWPPVPPYPMAGY